jgi:hypothetical protein
MTGWMDDQIDGRMDDETNGWNDASRRPLLYVIAHGHIHSSLYMPLE